MQCPRCGLVNQPGITACARCGLPAPQVPPSGQGRPAQQTPQTQQTQQTPPGQPGQQGGRSGPYPPPAQQQPGAPRPPQPGQQGFGQPGYGAPGYGQPGAYPGQPQHTQPIPRVQQTWPLGTAGSTATTSRTSAARDTNALVTVVALAAGALLSLVYAVWAFTARRGIFADFSHGTPVSSDHAKSSDRIDTVLLVLAGLVVIAALALWVTRMASGRTSGGALDLGGLAAAGVGVVVVLVGLFLSSRISDGIDQAAQGDRGVTATVLTGAGFLVIAIALAVGILAVRGGRASTAGATGTAGPSGSSTYAPTMPGGSPGW